MKSLRSLQRIAAMALVLMPSISWATQWTYCRVESVRYNCYFQGNSGSRGCQFSGNLTISGSYPFQGSNSFSAGCFNEQFRWDNVGDLTTADISYPKPSSPLGACRLADSLSVAINAQGQRNPAFDPICTLKTAREQGAPQTRCTNDASNKCVPSEGGDLINGAGDNDVPRNGWYKSEPDGGAAVPIRCVCGCLPGNTNILTSSGYLAISTALETANDYPVRLRVPGNSLVGFAGLSRPLFQSDFTRGEEKKPLIHITLSDGKELELTEAHPVLVKHGKKSEMIQAHSLTVGKILFDAENRAVRVVALSSRAPYEGELVFNVDTGERKSSDHVIAANGLKIGDLLWQRTLSERAARMALLKSTHNSREGNRK